jgi:hypothetical protein
VVHALADEEPMCRLRLRALTPWRGAPPLRLCQLCAPALTARILGPAWQPTRGELAELHLYAADSLVADVRERLAEIRSAAIADGSALVAVEQLPTYRASRGIPAAEPVPPLRTATILGELLDRVAPRPVVVSAAAEVAAAQAAERATENRSRQQARAQAVAHDRRQLLRDARKAKKR